jgi:iron complex outermembrane receptor protein
LVKEQALDYQFDTFTQEFRLSSTNKSGIQWTAGLFYSNEDTVNDRTVIFGSEMNMYATLILGTIDHDGDDDGINTNPTPEQNVIDIIATTFDAFPGIDSAADFFVEGGGSQQELFNMNSETVSLFANADIPLADNWTATVGLNKTHDKKTVTSDVEIDDLFSTLPLAGSPFDATTIAQFFLPFTDYPNNNENGIFKSDDLTHTLRLTHDLSENTKVYASHSTGFKPISVNLSVNATDSDSRSADEEYSENLEVGVKHSMDNGYINIALFDQKIEGFQSNTFNGQAFELTNAGNQKHRGFELDMKQQVSEELLLGLSAMYIDAKYLDYQRGPCDHVTTGVDDDMNPDTPENDYIVYSSVACDLEDPLDATSSLGYKNRSGETPAGIHDWSANLNANVPAVSETFFGQPVGNIPALRSSKNFNMSMGFNHAPSGIEVMLWGRNLTNHQALLSAFPTTAAPGSYGGYPTAPKTYGLTARATF